MRVQSKRQGAPSGLRNAAVKTWSSSVGPGTSQHLSRDEPAGDSVMFGDLVDPSSFNALIQESNCDF